MRRPPPFGIDGTMVSMGRKIMKFLYRSLLFGLPTDAETQQPPGTPSVEQQQQQQQRVQPELTSQL
jgi:hypothetical protein